MNRGFRYLEPCWDLVDSLVICIRIIFMEYILFCIFLIILISNVSLFLSDIYGLRIDYCDIMMGPLFFVRVPIRPKLIHFSPLGLWVTPFMAQMEQPVLIHKLSAVFKFTCVNSFENHLPWYILYILAFKFLLTYNMVLTNIYGSSCRVINHPKSSGFPRLCCVQKVLGFQTYNISLNKQRSPGCIIKIWFYPRILLSWEKVQGSYDSWLTAYLVLKKRHQGQILALT
jgi:hypothetical protein